MFKNRFILLALIFLFAIPTTTLAIARVIPITISPTPTIQNIISAYMFVQNVVPQQTALPVPLEIPIETNILSDYIVVDESTKTLQPRTIISKYEDVLFTVKDYQTATPAALMTDNNVSTYESFNLEQGNVDSGTATTATLLFEYNTPIVTSELVITLDQNVTMPDYISIQAQDPQTDQYEYVVNNGLMSRNVYLPQTTAKRFLVTINYRQPLRISEMSFKQTSPAQNYLRFVARPNIAYKVYSSPQGDAPYIPYLDNLNLTSTNLDTVAVDSSFISNPDFKIPDSDQDGVDDNLDNCRHVANPDQADTNKNKMGDACEDSDFDGMINAEDNCPDHSNPNQQDEDGDGIGDHCDGEESRWIEQMSFLPWIGIGVGFLVVLGLFKFSMTQKNFDPNEEKIEETAIK